MTKNNLSVDFDGREKKSSVVHRFITAKPESERIKEFHQNMDIDPEKDDPEVIFTDLFKKEDPPEEAAAEEPADAVAGVPEFPDPLAPPANFYLRNVMETIVIEDIAAILKNTAGICKCERCFSQICADVLNSLPHLYVFSEQDELAEKAVNVLNYEKRKVISDAVFRETEELKNRPPH